MCSHESRLLFKVKKRDAFNDESVGVLVLWCRFAWRLCEFVGVRRCKKIRRGAVGILDDAGL